MCTPRRKVPHAVNNDNQIQPLQPSMGRDFDLNPMTRERLHAIALILTTEDYPVEPGPLGRAALDEYRAWERWDNTARPGHDWRANPLDEIDYRAVGWYDQNCPGYEP